MCYIHELSPVKKAKSGKTEYYNFTAQTEGVTHKGVSFRMDLREKFETSASQKKAVKLTNVKRKANWKDNNLQDIEVNRYTQFETVSSVGFTHKEMKHDVASVAKIKNIKEKGYDRQIVTVVGYVDTVNAAVSTMDVHGSSKRMDIFVNDNSGVILFSIWNDKAVQLKQNGVYEIQNTVVRNFQELILSSSSETNIIPSSSKIEKLQPPFALTTKMSFPVPSVSVSQKSLSALNVTVWFKKIASLEMIFSAVLNAELLQSSHHLFLRLWLHWF